MSGAAERAPLPRTERQPAPARVLLLCPHPDDDVIGAGGTACLHAMAGDPVQVLIAYSGLAGDPDGRWERDEYLAMRRDEARRGGAHLGLEHYEFWDYPEGHEPTDAEYRVVAERLAAYVRELRPGVVYAPWVGEHHLDHHVLGRAARMALQLAGFQGQAWGYEVWTPLVATRVVDISSVYERKVAALREHHTQMEYKDVVHLALAVSAQRAIYLEDGARHGEAFCPLGEASAEELAILSGGP